jgi:hypothetical protein
MKFTMAMKQIIYENFATNVGKFVSKTLKSYSLRIL